MSENGYCTGQHDARPWGDWTVIDAGPGFAVKRIRVTPGGVLSLQRHRHRGEHWVVVDGTATVTLDAGPRVLRAGEALAIPQGAVHRVANEGTADLVFIEVQHGAVLSEEDIERLEDHYGRSCLNVGGSPSSAQANAPGSTDRTP